MPRFTRLHAVSTSQRSLTPPEWIRRINAVLGGISLDPASCAEANIIVGARHFYTREQDGLRLPWRGRSTFVNPPYGRGEGHRSNQDLWSEKFIIEYEAGHFQEGILLVNSSTGSGWYQRLLWHGFPVCLVDGRIHFLGNGKSEQGPTHDNAFVYAGPHEDLFTEVFHRPGVGCVMRYVAPAPERDDGQESLWDLPEMATP